MDFWMEDEEATGAGGHGSSQALLSQASEGVDSSFVCEQCGGNECYRDSATGYDVCSSCFTQSQQYQQQSNHGEVEEMDYDDAMAVAAKSKGGRVMAARRGKQSVGRPGASQRPLSSFDKSKEIPELATCLEGMRQVIKSGLERLARLAKLNQEQQSQANQVAKHLLISYVQSWGEAAEHYGKLYPQVRFSFRDLFLPGAYRRALLSVLLEQVIRTIKTEDTQEDHDDDDDDDVIAEQVGSSDLPEVPDDENMQYSKPKRGRKRKDKEDDVANKTYPHLLRRIVERGGATQKGRHEAALILTPGMEMLASILWLSVTRLGVAPTQMLEWIINGALPLYNAHKHMLKDEDSRKRLQTVRLVFQLRSFPHLQVLEGNATLLLLCANVKSLDSFSGASLTGSARRRQIRTLSVAAIPVMTARVVADVGLPQSVLDTALALMGVLEEDLFNNGDRFGLPRSMKNVTVREIHTINHVAAVVLCAVLLQKDWRQLVVVVRKSSQQEESSLDHGFIPWTEDRFRLLTNGSSLDTYLQYCEDNLETCQKKWKADVLHDSLYLGSVPQEDDTTSTSKQDEAIRPCPSIAGVSLHLLSYTHRVTLLQQRIYSRLKVGQRKRWKESPRGVFPYLDPHEALLLEFLAYSTRTQPSKIERALVDILNYAEL